MHVHATAGVLFIRLGHEGGLHVVFFCHHADQAFQRQRMVAGLQHVVGMVQIDFKLTGRGFGHRTVCRQPLQACQFVDLT
ncbi:hypothetical protein D3C76_988820 [compost metagenome]